MTKIVFPVKLVAQGESVQTTSQRVLSDRILVRALRIPPGGTRVELLLYLPDRQPAAAVQATARTESAGTRETGFWAEFVALPPAVKARLETLIERFEAVAAGGGGGADAGGARSADLGLGQRSNVRHDTLLRVAFATEKQFVEEYAANISAGGIFVETAQPPTLDSFVTVRLELPDGGAPAEVRGQVVHVSAPGDASGMLRPGVGVQFVDGNDEFRARLDAFLSSLAQR